MDKNKFKLFKQYLSYIDEPAQFDMGPIDENLKSIFDILDKKKDSIIQLINDNEHDNIVLFRNGNIDNLTRENQLFFYPELEDDQNTLKTYIENQVEKYIKYTTA